MGLADSSPPPSCPSARKLQATHPDGEGELQALPGTKTESSLLGGQAGVSWERCQARGPCAGLWLEVAWALGGGEVGPYPLSWKAVVAQRGRDSEQPPALQPWAGATLGGWQTSQGVGGLVG